MPKQHPRRHDHSDQVPKPSPTTQPTAPPQCRPEHPRQSMFGRLIPVNRWPEVHDWPPLGGLRHLIFNAAENGFDTVVRRVGRRVLIDEQAFFAWVDRQGAST